MELENHIKGKAYLNPILPNFSPSYRRALEEQLKGENKSQPPKHESLIKKQKKEEEPCPSGDMPFYDSGFSGVGF